MTPRPPEHCGRGRDNVILHNTVRCASVGDGELGAGAPRARGRGRCAFRGARTPLQWHCPPLWLCAPRTAGRSLPPASVLGPPFRVPDGLGRLGPSCPQRGSGRGARGRQVAHLPGETASVQPKPRPHAHATGHTAHAHAEWRRPAPSAAEEWPPPERGWTHERVQSRWVPPAGQADAGPKSAPRRAAVAHRDQPPITKCQAACLVTAVSPVHVRK